MAMPETAIREEDRTEPRKNKVRTAGKTAVVQAIAEATGMETVTKK